MIARLALVALLRVWSWHPTVSGDSWDHRCPVCEALGLHSEVLMSGSGACTAMYCGPDEYDESGNFVPAPACNHCYQDVACSLGHAFTVSDRSR